MRTISGKFKGRIIKDLRPTSSKVREALFNILADIQGLSFLDLYAGLGTVGLGASSKGASKVVFVEKNRRNCQVIKKSIEILETRYPILDTRKKPESTSKSQTSVIAMDVLRAIALFSRQRKKFDIVFLDPPYYQDLAKKTLKIISHYDIVAPNGLIICQHFRKDILPELIGDLRLIRQAKYGDTILTFYKR